MSPALAANTARISAVPTTDVIIIGGKPVTVEAVTIDGQIYVTRGRFLRIASLKEEWTEDVKNPPLVIDSLARSARPPDLVRFWQRLPDQEPKYPFYHEKLPIAAIPISTYDHWWNKQINGKTRNMVRKSEKLGVTFREAPFDDGLVRDIMGVFDESPFRRGKRFWHFRKDFDSVKREMGLDLPGSFFVGGYIRGLMIGFIKVRIVDRYAMTTMILDRIAHRDKAVTNGMIAKSVEICARRQIPYLTYTHWRRGEHGDFQKRNGFAPFPVPEYFIPLTLKGRVALSLHLHRGMANLLPAPLLDGLLDFRSRWYGRIALRHIRREGIASSAEGAAATRNSPPAGDSAKTS